MDLGTLRSELLTDPTGAGYAGMTDAQAAAALNTRGRGVDRDVIPAREIIEATVPAEWAALSAAEKQRYQTITGAGEISVKSPNVRAAFAAMFAPGTATRAALQALQSAGSISRAEELGLPRVGGHHVKAARNGVEEVRLGQ